MVSLLILGVGIARSLGRCCQFWIRYRIAAKDSQPQVQAPGQQEQASAAFKPLPLKLT